MSDWPPCRDGGGAGGAGQKLTHPLPPILRPQQPDTGQPPDNAPPNISQPKSLRSAVFSKVIFTLFKLILECKVSLFIDID